MWMAGADGVESAAAAVDGIRVAIAADDAVTFWQVTSKSMAINILMADVLRGKSDITDSPPVIS
jgi:hypothetical protein